MAQTALLYLLGIGLLLTWINASAITSCTQHFSCLTFSEGGCRNGKRRVCLNQNSAPASSVCALNDVTPPTSFRAMCALEGGTVRASGTNIVCHEFGAGTTATFRADGGAAGSSPSGGSILQLGTTTSRAASCTTPGSRVCPGSFANELMHTFVVSDCMCNCGSWGSWSACVGTNGCSNLKRTRTRSCTAPANPGDVICQSSQEESCSSSSSCPDCTCDSSWSNWSGCSVTCGSGTRTRRKACRSNSAASCNDIVQSESCNQGTCPDTSGFACLCGGWTSWSSCSATCGSGTTRRTRTCSRITAVSNSSCPVNVFPREQSKPCNKGSCSSTSLPCSCGNWVNVGRCVGTCGTGIQSRERICTNCPSSVHTVDTISCETGITCPSGLRCQCGHFRSLGCSVTCGFGTETRVRDCTNCPVNTITSITVPCGTGNRCRRGGRRFGRRRNRGGPRRCRRLRTAVARRLCRLRNRRG